MRPRIPARDDFRFWCEEKLRNADTDQFHHVNNAVMATFFEAGRMEVFGAADVKALMGSANIAVVRLLMNFHRELFYPGKVSIGTSLTRIGDRSFEIAQGLFDDEGCVASADVVCVLLDPAARGAHPVSAPLRQQLLDGGTVR
jgi:acyl-CoA thioester hydrolase